MPFAGSAPNNNWTSAAAPTTFTGTNASRAWSADEFVSLQSASCLSTNANVCNDLTLPAGGKLTGVRFDFSSALANGSNYLITLYKGTTSTGSTCPITGNGSVTGCSIAYNANDPAGTTYQLLVHRVSNFFTTKTAATTQTATVTVSGGDTNYVSLSTACVSTVLATCNVATAVSAGTLANASLTFADNVASGNSFAVTLMVNGVASGSACTITAGNQSCTIAGGLAIPANAKLELRVTHATGTDPFVTSATSALTETVTVTNPGTTLTAPALTTTQGNDQVVRFYGTGATSFTAGSAFTAPGSSTATGVDDAVVPGAGPTNTATATSNASANWVAQSVALRLQTTDTSISIDRPQTAVDGDFLLLSVTAKGSVGTVCAPDLTWSRVFQTTQGSGSGQVTQATFWSVRSGTSAETYTFTFHSGNCSSGSSAVAASAVVVRYTGVDPINPIDASAAATTPGANPGAALTAPPASPRDVNDRIVRIYGTASSSISAGATFTQTGPSTATGITDSPQAASGATGTAGATTDASARWIGQTVALRDIRSSISIARPSNSPTAGDFLLVSVTAENLGTGNICAPDDGTWALVRQDTQGSVTEATFQTFRQNGSAETYQFAFRTGACPSSGNAAAGIAATAVAVRYTGVDPTSPIDTSSVTAPGSSPGTALTSPSVTTATGNERVVRFYGTGATSLTGVQLDAPGSSTATGAEETTQAAGAGPTGSATSPTSSDWVAQTIALNVSDSIVIGRPANRSDADFMLVSVTAEGLGSGNICAADDVDWTLIRQTVQGTGSSSITQATFYSTRGETDDELYQFNFRSAACQPGGTGGTGVAVAASAIAARYTGVNLVAPTDGDGGNPSGSGSDSYSGSAGATNWTSNPNTRTDTYTNGPGGSTTTNWTTTAGSTPATFNGPATPSTNFTANPSTNAVPLNGPASPSTNLTSNTNGVPVPKAGGVNTRTWTETAAAPRYVSLSSTCSSASSTTCDVTSFAQAGSVTTTFTFSSATGNNQSYTISLLKNHVTATPLGTCNIGANDSTPTCSISGTVGASDTVEFSVARTGTSSLNSAVTTSVTETPTFTAGNDTNYVSLATSCVSPNPTPTCNDATLAAAGTLTSATLTLGAAVPTGDSFTVTLYSNGSSTGSTCPITAGQTSCSVTPTGGAIAAGPVEMRISRSGGSVAFVTTATAALNELVTLTPAGNNTNYVSLSTSCITQTANGTCNNTTLTSAGTLTSASLTLAANVPTGDSMVVTLFTNGAATGSKCTIAANANTCAIAPTGIALAAGTKVELQIVNTGTSRARHDRNHDTRRGCNRRGRSEHQLRLTLDGVHQHQLDDLQQHHDRCDRDAHERDPDVRHGERPEQQHLRGDAPAKRRIGWHLQHHGRKQQLQRPLVGR